ncbi:hypothetical protein AVEN_24343-1, partial [Araneus ventricosus]
ICHDFGLKPSLLATLNKIKVRTENVLCSILEMDNNGADVARCDEEITGLHEAL